MFEEIIVKLIFPILGSIASAAFIGTAIWFWKIPDKIDKHSELLERLVGKVDGNSDRIEVHDKLATNVFGKTISSKLISEGKQNYPVFHAKKLREDH